MKNILLIIPYGSVGGMERLADSFYKYYKNKKNNVKVIKLIQLENDIVNFGNDEIAFSQKDFVEMSFLFRFFFYLKVPFLIRNVIKKHKIDHSISFGDMCNVFSSITFTKENKVASIHALKSVELISKSFLNNIFKLSYKTTYRFFDKVVCISNAIKIDLINNCDYKFSNNLKVIYNPHNINTIVEMAKQHLDSVEEESLFSNDIILFLGRISYQKAPWHLVKAFKLLSIENPEVRLVFIGDGDENLMKYLKELITDFSLNEKIYFLGRKNNPYKYLTKAKVLALTSYYEGTPNVIVESIVCETPIVSSNCTDGIIELMGVDKGFVDDGLIETESGFITPNFFKGSLGIPKSNNCTEDEKIFNEALKKVINNDCYKINLIKNKNQLLKKFNLENVCLDYIKLQ